MRACGNRGCFAAHVSGKAPTRRAKAAGIHPGTLIELAGSVSAASVFVAAAEGDALAQKLVEEEAEILGRGSAILGHLYSRDMIIAGWGLSHQFQSLIPNMSRSMKEVAMPVFKDIPIVRAALGGKSGLVGAAGLIFD